VSHSQPLLTTFDPFWLTFLFFCILDSFTRVFKGLLLVLKDLFLLLFSTFALFCIPEATSSILVCQSPPPPLSYPQVIQKLSTGLSSSNAAPCTGPRETWHDSCMTLGIHRINGEPWGYSWSLWLHKETKGGVLQLET
jgi:hypothetical protein